MRSLSKAKTQSVRSARVPPLISTKVDGTQYERRDDVRNEIMRTLDRSQEEWATMAKGIGKDRISNETLVFLVRHVRHCNYDLFGKLVHELGRRLSRIAAHWVYGFDTNTTEEIILEVDMEIIELVLTATPSRQSEFLEIAFGKAVERRTINAVEKRKNSPLPLLPSSADTVGNGDEPPERTTERIADDGPRPDDEADLRMLISMGIAAVTDPLHREAVVLRYLHGWPLTDKDPSIPTLEHHFQKSGRQIQNWITQALKEMRAAIGDKP